MAGKSTTLTVRILGDPKGLQSSLGSAETRVDRFERRLGSASKVAAGALVGMAAAGKELYDAASALQQSSGAVESVFGKQADAVKKLASNAAEGVGLSANAYQELAAVMGAQLKNMGVAQDQLAPKTDKLIQMGADMAATYGGTTADAVAALSSLMRGEADPIERYGVSIKKADIAAKMAADGTDKLRGAQGKAATTAALMALLQQQTGAATGAFGREADTAAGQTQRASAAFEDAKAALGESLLPVVTIAAQKFSGLATWVKANSKAVTIGAAVFGGLAVTVLAVNGAVKAGRAAMAAYKAIVTAVRTAQLLWNLAMMANPLGLIVLAIAAVIAVAVLLYKKFEPIRVIVGKVKDWFVDAFGWVLDNVINPFLDALQWVWDKLEAVGDFIGSVGSAIGGLFGGGAALTVQATTAGPALAGISAPLRGATMGTSAGGGSLSPGAAGRGSSGGNTYVTVTVEGALDPVAVGRQIDQLSRRWAQNTGRSAIAIGGR